MLSPPGMQTQAQQRLDDRRLSDHENTLWQRLADSEQAVHDLTARTAELERMIGSQSAALEISESCLSAAQESAREAAASLETAIKRRETLQAKLTALRRLTGDANRELREEVAVLRAQVDGAERSAAELKAEANAAAAAAAAARASQAEAAVEAARAAEEAARQHASDREAVETLRMALAEAQQRADAAAVLATEAEAARLDEAREEGRADALAEFSAAAAAADAAADGGGGGGGGCSTTEEGREAGGDDDGSSSRVVVCAAGVRSLARELDAVALCAREAAATAARAGWVSSGEGRGAVVVAGGRDADGAAVMQDGERGTGEGVVEDDDDQIGRMLAVAVRAAVDVEALRRSLVLADDNVSPDGSMVVVAE